MIKLSIITINYNNAEGLRKTMESVFAQTYRDFEYIVVDGESTDSSVEVIKDYVHKVERVNDERKKVIWSSEPDGGVYEAMNKGIQKARGEYCLFLNSGDFLIAPEVLERVFAIENNADIINARCNVSDKGKVIWTSPYLPKIALKDMYFDGLPHQSTFIRRNLFDKYGMYREDFRYNSDIEFWYRTIVLGDATTRGLDIVTTDYNMDGISSKEAGSETYQKEMTEILSQGFLPKVLPDYEAWRAEKMILSKYKWIEKHPIVLQCLNFINKIYKHI